MHSGRYQVDTPGLYRISETSATWYLNQNRACPRLKIKRRQVMLVPAFAVTIHSTQCANKDNLVLDVCISNECSRQTCHVAHSRTRTREGIHILRPFPLDMFRCSPPLGPQLLLKHVNKEAIDWATVAEQLRSARAQDRSARDLDPMLPCARCGLQP